MHGTEKFILSEKWDGDHHGRGILSKFEGLKTGFTCQEELFTKNESENGRDWSVPPQHGRQFRRDDFHLPFL